MKKYKNLDILLCTYFNQDFSDMTGTVEETIRAFCKDCSLDELLDTLLEIQDIYAKDLDKEEFTNFLEKKFRHCYYNFLYDFPDGRVWLEYVESIIKEELPKKRS